MKLINKMFSFNKGATDYALVVNTNTWTMGEDFYVKNVHGFVTMYYDDTTTPFFNYDGIVILNLANIKNFSFRKGWSKLPVNMYLGALTGNDLYVYLNTDNNTVGLLAEVDFIFEGFPKIL